MSNADIDKTGLCRRCGAQIEHYAGVPGSEFMTPFWRHTDAVHPDVPHGAEPDEDTVREVTR